MAGATFEPPMGDTGYPRLLVQERRPYPTTDGHLCVLIYTDRHWEKFLGLIGQGQLFEQDPRFASIGARTRYINELYQMVAQAMATQSTEVWMACLTEADIPCMPMHDIDSLLQDPHLLAVGMLQEVIHPTEGLVHEIGVPIRFSGTPTLPIQKPAPQLGQHSAEVLREVGLSDAAIEGLQKSGVSHG
jgi:crotonobetainyl-CoA:carnitine CoA-transferase CaiB-like acyl-CoA transferase